MPKRRGRSTAGASRRSGASSFGDIGELLHRMQDTPATAASVCSVEAPRRGETEAASWETTLSPDVRAPPPPPRITSSPRVEELPEDGLHLPLEARKSTEGSREMDSLSFQVSPGEAEDSTTSVGNRAQERDNQDLLSAGEKIKTIKDIYTIEKPREVTLDSIWDLVANLVTSLKPQLALLEDKLENQDTDIKNLKVEMKDSKNSIENIQQELKVSKQLSETLVRDNSNLRRKLEFLENSSQNNNLRLINFPRIAAVPPRDMLKRYITEIWEISEDMIPPFTHVYYLPSKIKEQQLQRQDDIQPLNVSAMLELSDRESAVAATLLVTVALAPDKNWLLRLFFKNKQKDFLGHKVLMFPDLGRDTQKRRREFLMLKPGVISLGGSFFLRHPCKCIIHYRMTKYVFFEPPQLTAFLAGARMDEGKVLSAV
uniref:Uncharacterized protein LOC117345818 n=1 Tax=Geotrypetes seraphini TaxID=260995 RepID=A0A6P8P605_GEOSA|nr:uncharacterized protein LOC117345818 [Geotrypetes seraphini]